MHYVLEVVLPNGELVRTRTVRCRIRMMLGQEDESRLAPGE